MTSNCFSNSRRFSCTFQHENLPVKSTVSVLIFRYFSNIYRAGPDAVVPKNFLKMLWQKDVPLLGFLPLNAPASTVPSFDDVGAGVAASPSFLTPLIFLRSFMVLMFIAFYFITVELL